MQGIVAAGLIYVGTNPSYTPYEFEHAIKTSQAKIIIAEPELLGAPKAVAASLGMPANQILLLADESDGTHQSWRSLLTHGEQDWLHFDDLETAKNTTAFLVFSSGTTGLPKAAQLSHYNLVAQHTIVFDNPDHPSPFPISLLCALPFFHVAMAPYVNVSALRSGLPAFIMRRFEPQAYLDAVQKYQITKLIVVPPVVVALLNIALQNPARVKRAFKSVRSAVGGAAPLDAKTQNRFQALLPADAPMTQLWGMTETTCVATYLYPPEGDSTGSVGRLVQNLDAKLVDDNGKEVGPYDIRGELCIRGPTVIKGYLNNPKANAESWDDEGYFHTGDVAICDSKTHLWYIVDRKKELIKTRGFQVSPAEIEGVLLGHPGVQDVAVFGVFVKGEEVPRAHVVKREGVVVSEKDIKRWVGEKLEKYKQLEGGVRFVASIPKVRSMFCYPD